MDGFLKVWGAIALTVAGICFLPIVAAAAGYFAGWLVGLVFADTILPIAAQVGIRDVTMGQLGCFFGFIGGFLKTKVTAKVTES